MYFNFIDTLNLIFHENDPLSLKNSLLASKCFEMVLLTYMYLTYYILTSIVSMQYMWA